MLEQKSSAIQIATAEFNIKEEQLDEKIVEAEAQIHVMKTKIIAMEA